MKSGLKVGVCGSNSSAVIGGTIIASSCKKPVKVFCLLEMESRTLTYFSSSTPWGEKFSLFQDHTLFPAIQSKTKGVKVRVKVRFDLTDDELPQSTPPKSARSLK
jgi:hypothetical protein